jgi:uncharacterized protein
MILYLDTSALVKLYAKEAGTLEVQQAVTNAEQIATSLIAYVETRSALARKYRLDQVDGAALRRHKREFEHDWAQLNRLPLDATTLRRAADLAELHRLRAYDAVHLATADLLQAAVRAPVAFACFDNALNEAASWLGLKLVPGRLNRSS